MEEMNDQYLGPLHLTGSSMLNGLVSGDVIVVTSERVMINGTVTGDVIIRRGCIVDVNGTVIGGVINEGADVVVRGVVATIEDRTSHKTAIERNAIVGGERRL